MSILHTLSLQDRPIYKVTKTNGGAGCSTAELLAALMGGPDQIEVAYALVAKFGGLPAMLNATDTEIQEVNGIGLALAARLKAALEIGRRLMMVVPEDRVVIRSPGDTASVLMPELSHLEQEHFVVLVLNTRNEMMSKYTLYRGNGNSMTIRVAEVFQEAVRRGAASIIVAHNHPSGDPAPSPEDVAITRTLVQAGDLMGIEVLDHMVIGEQRFISMKERGLGFS